MHDPARIPFSKIAVCIGKAGDSRIYFMADLHFYHDHIIRLANRPYQNAVKMNQALVENWNRRICGDDEVYILGDVTMKNHVYAREMLKKRKGRKYLIEGNHDRFVHQKEFDQSIFTWVKQMHELKYAGNTNRRNPFSIVSRFLYHNHPDPHSETEGFSLAFSFFSCIVEGSIPSAF